MTMPMNLNIVDIIIIAIMALTLVAGMYKGFMASGLSTLGFAAAFFGAQHYYPQLSLIIQSNTSLMNVLTYYLDASSIFATAHLGETSVVGAAQSGLLAQAVSELQARGLPDAIVTAFQTNVGGQLFANMGFSTFADYLNQTIWSATINVVSFLLLFIAAYIVVMLLVSLLNNVFHFPLLRHFDWLLGGIFGLIKGYIVVSLLLSLVPLVISVVDLSIIQKTIDASVIASYFPKNFIVSDIIVSAFR